MSEKFQIPPPRTHPPPHFVCVCVCVCVCTRLVVSDSLQPQGLYPARLLCPWNSPGKDIGVGCHALLQGIFPTQGSEPEYPTLQVDPLLSEPPGNLRNTGVGSLSLLQRIFPTQELNQSLLHCRQILSQLSYWGSPHILE